MQRIVHERVIILDFGSQYTQLIARRVREAGVYCEILPFNASVGEIESHDPRGLILSGGPSSVYDENAPHPNPELLSGSKCPVLGICYGLQLIAHKLGGEVQPSRSREYGYARLTVLDSSSRLFAGLPQEMDVWMSHGDQVNNLPDGFRVTARTGGATSTGCNFIPRLLTRLSALRFCATFFSKSAVAQATGHPAPPLRSRPTESENISGKVAVLFADFQAESIRRLPLRWFTWPSAIVRPACLLIMAYCAKENSKGRSLC